MYVCVLITFYIASFLNSISSNRNLSILIFAPSITVTNGAKVKKFRYVITVLKIYPISIRKDYLGAVENKIGLPKLCYLLVISLALLDCKWSTLDWQAPFP